MLTLYNRVREVPKDAQKTIKGGRLNGYTDINPMWRIKTLTEQFGACGEGWYAEVLKQWIEDGANEERAAFCNINLYVKNGEEWSKPIFGTGGSSFVAKEKSGLYTNDECFKMAYTDAISVACKSLGMGADIYWQNDRSKYDRQDEPQEKPQKKPQDVLINDIHIKVIHAEIVRVGWTEKLFLKNISAFCKTEINSIEEITMAQFTPFIKWLERKESK